MKYSNWIGIIACLLLIISGYLPWGIVPVNGHTQVTGFGSASFDDFGKPVLFNLYLLPLNGLLFLIPRIWAKKINPFVAAIGLAWALKNLLLFITCRGGFCPTPLYGIFIYFSAAAIILLMTLLIGPGQIKKG